MKRKLFFISALALMVAGAIFWSCQKDEISVNAEDGINLKQAEVCENNILPTFPDIPDCDENCIDADPYVQGTVSFVRQWAPLAQFSGYYKNNKYFTAEAWNDGDKVYVKSTVFGYQYDQEGGSTKVLTGPTCDNYPFNTVIITLDGTPYTFEMDDPETTEIVETATEYTAEFLLDDLFPDGWEKCDEIEYTVRLEGQGQPVWLGTDASPANVVYTLFEVCPVGCDDEFTLEVVSECGETERYAEFLFIAGERGEVKIQGGLTAGATGTTSEVYVNNGLVGELNYDVAAGHVHNWIGTLEECDEVVIKIWWSADNEEIIDDWTVERDGTEVGITDPVDCEDE